LRTTSCSASTAVARRGTNPMRSRGTTMGPIGASPLARAPRIGGGPSTTTQATGAGRRRRRS
ncbi:MAG: hypothetical protein ABGW82_03450, partial [Paracoccus sp. (in: a-proteobacteria)]